MADQESKEANGNILKSLLRTGFFHIFGASTVNKVLSVVLSFVLVRLLSKADYGVYAYAYNIASFFIIFNGFGVASAILQICSEMFDQKGKFLGVFYYGYRWGVVIDLAMGVCIFLVALLVPLQITSAQPLLMLYCIYPLVMLLYEIKVTRLRVDLMNKEYGLALNIQSVLMLICSIGGAFLLGALGLVLGQILAYTLAYVYLCLKYHERDRGDRLSKPEKKDFWKISGLSAFNNGLSSVFYLTGTFFIGQFIGNDTTIASYQVATLIPTGLTFIPSALMTYAYPYFARNRNNGLWTRRNYLRLLGGSILVMGLLTALICLLATPIIQIMFGEQYTDIVPAFQILMIGFFIQAVFRIPAGNLLVTQRKLLVNSFVGVVAIVVNIACCVMLIPAYSMEGAAFTQLITMVVSSVLNCSFYAYTIRRLPEEGVE